MTHCPTPEQLAAISLGLTDDARLIEHAETCEACIRVRSAQSEVVDRLSDIHGRMDVLHASSRARLLERLPVAIDRYRPSRWRRWGVGGGAAAAILLLAFVAIAPNRLSAMERIASAVRDVHSFTYRLTNDSEFPLSNAKPSRTRKSNTFTAWRAPPLHEPDQFGDFRGAQHSESVYHLPAGDETKVTIDLIEIHPSGKPGILIDYLAKKYYRVPALHAVDIAGSTPLLWLRAVREQAGRITKDLGTRKVSGRTAHGYTMAFDDFNPFNDFGPVEVWIDPETNLPVEFSFEYAMPDPGFTDRYIVTDIQWNAELDPKLFDTTAPTGFLDVTIPTDDESIAAIVEALNLYAELSGGQYPHFERLEDRNFTSEFDSEACYRKMLEFAGLTNSNRDNSLDEPLYQRIQNSRAGLDMLERILHSYKWLIGYYGDTVGRQDKDKVVLWWNIALNSSGDQYRVFYGDLRTEVVTGKQWARLVPPEIAKLAE